ILVEDHAINHQVVACSHIMDADRDPYFDLGSYCISVEDLAAPRHISDRLAEAVRARSAAFPEHDLTARSVLRDRAVAFSRGRRCSGLRDLSPSEWGHNCQRHA